MGQKTCQAYSVELIVWVSKLYKECQNLLTQFQRYDQFNFWGPDFNIGHRGVIFGDFSLILPIDVECTKIVTKMHSMDRMTKQILNFKFFENVC